jgi:hypothetical protein
MHYQHAAMSQQSHRQTIVQVHAVIYFSRLPIRRLAIHQPIAFLEKNPSAIFIETACAGSFFERYKRMAGQLGQRPLKESIAPGEDRVAVNGSSSDTRKKQA